MIIKKIQYLITFANIILISFLSTANTQNLSNNLDEIIVSASLIPLSEDQTANAITVINYEDIKNRSVSSISDLLRDVPGLAVSRSGVLGSQTQIRIRGSEANHLLVLIDGIEANNPGQSDELNWGTIVAADIERIEVIRGPQSSMYGSDAMSGVINITTKSASKSRNLDIFSESGSFTTQNNGASIGYNDNRFNFRIGLSQINTDGENISRTGAEKDGYKNKNINLKSGLKVNEKLKTSFSLRRSNGMNEYDSDNDFDGLIEDQDNVAKFVNTIFGLKADYLTSDRIRQHQLSISQSKSDNQDFNEGILGILTSSTKDQVRFISSIFWNEFNHRISVLAEHEKEKFSQRGFVNDYGVYGIFDPNQNQNRKTNSVAFEYRADMFDEIVIGISARQDYNSEFKNSNTYKFETIYNFSEEVLLRGSYGTAIKNPTFTERFGYYTNFIGNPFLQPEKSTNWEIGYDQKFNNGDFALSATIFNSELENEIDGNALDPITFGYTAINKNGLSKRKGLELNIHNKLNKNLIINFSYTYTDSTELNEINEYQDEVRRPRNISSINLLWQPNNSINLNTNIQYNGSQKDIVYPRNVKLSEYTIVNFSTNLNITDKIEGYIRLENIFDESYEEVYGYEALGFGAYIGIRYKI